MTNIRQTVQRQKGKLLVALGVAIGLATNPAINAVKAEYEKNTLAMTQLVPYIEMENGKSGLSAEDITIFYDKNCIPFRKVVDPSYKSTPGDLYFTLRNLPRDSIESLIQSYRQESK